MIADTLVRKGFAQAQNGQTEAAIATYDEAIRRGENKHAPGFQIVVANALVAKGIAQVLNGQTQAAITTSDEVIRRFENNHAPEFQTTTAIALTVKGVTETVLHLTEDALRTCDELERRFGDLTDKDAVPFAWEARRLRIKAWMVQGDRSAAMDAFHGVYAAFVPGNGRMLHMMIQLVSDLIAGGVSERDLVDLLSSDQEKLAKLDPLVVALRQRMGEEVRAPVEVMEVAASILAFIDMIIVMGRIGASSVTTD